jgi:hypothetical protein
MFTSPSGLAQARDQLLDALVGDQPSAPGELVAERVLQLGGPLQLDEAAGCRP